jgi:hypothetical protein
LLLKRAADARAAQSALGSSQTDVNTDRVNGLVKVYAVFWRRGTRHKKMRERFAAASLAATAEAT